MSDRRKERELVCKMIKASILLDLRHEIPTSRSELAKKATVVCVQCKTYYRWYALVLKDAAGSDRERRIDEVRLFSNLVEQYIARVFRELGIEDEEKETTEKIGTTLTF